MGTYYVDRLFDGWMDGWMDIDRQTQTDGWQGSI